MIRNSRLILDLASSLKDRIDCPIVGRSITDSPNQAASADAILKEIL